MKLLILFFFIFSILTSCADNNERSISPQTVKAQGGVDVGNMSSSVPATNAYFELLGNWKSKIEGNLLILENSSFSRIEASKVTLKGLETLNANELEKYLSKSNPERQYKIIKFNGLEGVRAELTNNDQTRISDIYLVSEGKDLIHIVANLNNSGDGFTEGEQIISTIRVKYIGTAYKNSPAITLDLSHQRDDVVYKYSFSQDCWEDLGCKGSMFELKDYNLSVEGNIVELGPEDTIAFDSIHVEGEFLVAPNSKFPISDIYADERGQSILRIKDGFVYLIRVDNGPEAGLIIKLKVTGELAGENTVFRYQKLVAVKPDAKP